MADKSEKKSNDSKPDRIVIVPKNSAEIQKIHVERLMKNIVRNLSIILLLLNIYVFASQSFAVSTCILNDIRYVLQVCIFAGSACLYS